MKNSYLKSSRAGWCEASLEGVYGTVLIEHCGKAYHPYERLRFGGAINAEDLITM